MLDPQQLRTFQEIARTGSYSAAAKKMGYTQPALSYQMRALERAIGGPLTIRAGRSIRLTKAGQTLLRHADQILTAIRVAERDLAHVVGSGAGVVRIATFPSAAATIVPDAIAAVRQLHALDVRITNADPIEARAMVTRGDAELAVTYRYDADDMSGTGPSSASSRSPLARVPLLTDAVHVVLHRRHLLAQTPMTGLWPLADESWLVATTMFADTLQRLCALAGFAARMTMVADDFVAMQSLVAKGVGIALLPGLALTAHQHDDVVANVLPVWPTRHVDVEAWPDLFRVPSVAAMVTALEASATAATDPAGAATYVLRPVGPTSPPAASFTESADAAWDASFRITRRSLPRYAQQRDDRAVVISNESGVDQVHTWERGSAQFPQLTSRDGGTALADITPDGEHVWWFADDNGNERGIWMIEAFDGGSTRPAAVDVPAAYPSGLVLGATRSVIAMSDSSGANVYAVEPEGTARLVYSHPEFAALGALSCDDDLIAISHSEHGDAQKPAVGVYRIDRHGTPATAVAELWDGSGFGVWPVAFSPVSGSTDLLVIHERHGRNLPLIWNPISGVQREIDPELAGETSPTWFADGSALLLLHQYRGRSELYRVDLETRQIARLSTPRGHITEAIALADGSVEYEWSSAHEPHRVLSTSSPPSAASAVESDHPLPSSLDDVSVAGTAGDIHALVSRPAGADRGPQPTVFLIHGGPAAHDTDSFSPVRNAWTETGFVVVEINYRGSTGYGAEWRNANIGRPGRAELEDIVAVRDAMVANGTTDPDRSVISGFSWGGCLALLGLGLYPDLWSVGIAAAPVADTAAVYDDMMEEIRAAYRVRFGGSPIDVPDAYAASSPLGVVADVRAPLMITAALNDPRCPIRQIELYVSRLVELQKQHEMHVFDWGHEPRSVAGRIDLMGRMLRFVQRHLGQTRGVRAVSNQER